jgi:hypothetical protein
MDKVLSEMADGYEIDDTAAASEDTLDLEHQFNDMNITQAAARRSASSNSDDEDYDLDIDDDKVAEVQRILAAEQRRGEAQASAQRGSAASDVQKYATPEKVAQVRGILAAAQRRGEAQASAQRSSAASDVQEYATPEKIAQVQTMLAAAQRRESSSSAASRRSNYPAQAEGMLSQPARFTGDEIQQVIAAAQKMRSVSESDTMSSAQMSNQHIMALIQ